MINHIELAKECGAHPCLACGYAMTDKTLAAYTNAVIEMCAEQACNGLDGYEIQQAILALKVKG